MLKELFEAVALQAVASSTPVEVPTGDPRVRRFSVGGLVKDFDAPEPPRDHHPGALAEVVALANRFAGGADAPAVWYDHEAVVLVIDDGGHRLERATLGLQPSDVFARLVELRANPTFAWRDQKAFIRLLRIELAGTLPPRALLDPVRKVKFENGSTVTSEVKRNRESMGREINSAVSGEGEIPEEVTLTAPVFKTPGECEPYPVRCTVETNPLTGEFRLLPLPDEIETVRSFAVDSIAARLREGLAEAVPAYFGKP